MTVFLLKPVPTNRFENVTSLINKLKVKFIGLGSNYIALAIFNKLKLI